MAIFQRFARNKGAVLFSLFLFAFILVGIGIFGWAHNAYAEAGAASQIGGKVLEGIGYIIKVIVKFLGDLIAMVLYVLFSVASYNDFIYSTAVSKGWGIVRDLCNMFFVLVLLAIAAGTILQQEKYHYSRTLPKFILMAILINFSKTICGLLIDFAQVVMMTFVGAIQSAGPGNFMALLGVQNLLTITSTPDAADFVKTFISLLLAVLLAFIALVVVTVITLQLIIRIVAIWFLVTLSPFAFFLSTFPLGEQYSAKWWKEFTNYVILGPVMIFFLWMALAVSQNAAEGQKDAGKIQIARELGRSDWPGAETGFAVGESIAGTVPGIAGFMLGVTMLLASLVAAQQLASVGGGMAGSALSGIKRVAAGTAQAPFRAAGGAARAGAGALGAGAKRAGAGALGLARTAADSLRKRKEEREKEGGKAPSGGAGARASIGTALKGAGTFTGAAARTSMGALKSAGTGVTQAGRAAIGGAIKTAGTLAKTNFGAIGEAGVEKAREVGAAAKTKLQAGMGAAKTAVQTGAGAVGKGLSAVRNLGDMEATDALKAVGGALGRGAKATGGFLKEDAGKTLGHIQSGAGAVGVGAKAAAGKVGETVQKGAQKLSDINQATDIQFLAGKIKKTEAWQGAKGIDEHLGIKPKEKPPAQAPELAIPPVPPAPPKPEEKGVVLAGTQNVQKAGGTSPVAQASQTPTTQVPQTQEQKTEENKLSRIRSVMEYAERGANENEKNAAKGRFKQLTGQEYTPENAAKYKEGGTQQPEKKSKEVKEGGPAQIPETTGGSQRVDFKQQFEQAKAKREQEAENLVAVRGREGGAGGEKGSARMNVGEIQAGKISTGALEVGGMKTGLEGAPKGSVQPPTPKEIPQKEQPQKPQMPPTTVKVEPAGAKPVAAIPEKTGTSLASPPMEKPTGVKIAELNKTYDAVRMQPDSPAKTQQLEKIHARRMELEAKMKEEVAQRTAQRGPAPTANESEGNELKARRQKLQDEYYGREQPKEQPKGASNEPTLRVSGFMPSTSPSSKEKPEEKRPQENKGQQGDMKEIKEKLEKMQKQGKETKESVDTLTRKFKTK